MNTTTVVIPVLEGFFPLRWESETREVFVRQIEPWLVFSPLALKVTFTNGAKVSVTVRSEEK